MSAQTEMMRAKLDQVESGMDPAELATRVQGLILNLYKADVKAAFTAVDNTGSVDAINTFLSLVSKMSAEMTASLSTLQYSGDLRDELLGASPVSVATLLSQFALLKTRIALANAS